MPAPFVPRQVGGDRAGLRAPAAMTMQGVILYDRLAYLWPVISPPEDYADEADGGKACPLRSPLDRLEGIEPDFGPQ